MAGPDDVAVLTDLYWYKYRTFVAGHTMTWGERPLLHAAWQARCLGFYYYYIFDFDFELTISITPSNGSTLRRKILCRQTTF